MDDTRKRRWRRASAGLGIVGLVLVLVGGVGLALDGHDDTDAATTSRAEPSRAGRPVASTEPAPTLPVTTTVPLTTRVETFFAAWADALRRGDDAFLLARLHPAVLARYGEPACVAALGPIQLAQASAQVLSTDAVTGTWQWTTDGLTTEVSDAIGLRLRRTEDGSTFTEADAHVALVDDEIRWFTDCGTPVG